MSKQLISRSPDLKRLRDEGYEVEVQDDHLLVNHVPYVTGETKVKYGTLVSTLTLAGDVTTKPDTHAAYFIGERPCNKDGEALSRIIIGDKQQLAESLAVDHAFSSKPREGYADYHEKMTAYIRILSGPAQALDPTATAQTFRPVEETDPDSVFEYVETASSHAGIRLATEKLRIGKLAIVGLGGTGSYVLDFVAKTPVCEIHLFDGDNLLQHNAFRAPGAPSIDELRDAPTKPAYLQERYAKMRRNIVAHESHVDASNVDELREMDFVFLCLDDAEAKKVIVEKLDEWGTSFIDVGIGVTEQDGSLSGLIRVTTSTPEKRDHVRESNRIPFTTTDADDDYRSNIQVAELNALNAALAVIKWKKMVGFYTDLEREHFSVYIINANTLINEDLA
jgi:hypothetical protein